MTEDRKVQAKSPRPAYRDTLVGDTFETGCLHTTRDFGKSNLPPAVLYERTGLS